MRTTRKILVVVSFVLLVIAYHALNGNLPTWHSNEHERFVRFYTAIEPTLAHRTMSFLEDRNVGGKAPVGQFRSISMPYRMNGHDATINIIHIADEKVALRC